MFEHLLSADPVPDRTTPLQTKAHAGKHAFLAWLSVPKLGSYPTPSHVSRLALLPVLALALAGTTLLACGGTDTSESTVSEQTTPTPAQVATQSTSPTAEKTSDTTSNGQSSSEATTQPAATPTKAAEVHATTPTSAPTPEPTDTPVPTPTPHPHHDFAQFLAPYDSEGDLVTRPTDDASQSPIYPFNEIRLQSTAQGRLDPYYPAYTQWQVRGGTPLKYPELANVIQRDIAYAISAATAEPVFEDNGPVPEQRLHTADDIHQDMDSEILKRMEWQLVDDSPKGITIRVFTTYISPDPVMWREPTRAHYSITAEAFLKSVKTAESQHGAIYTLRNDHEYAPVFSHLVGEPVIQRQ